MKNVFVCAVLTLLFAKTIHGQTIFWYEGFGVGCNQGQLAQGAVQTLSNGVWLVTTLGSQGASANEWFVSATEAGTLTGVCGNGCLSAPFLTNKTLHIGQNLTLPNLDSRAYYTQSATSNTNKRVESSPINCAAQSSITLSFNYMTNGDIGQNSFAEALYFEGTSWFVLNALITTTTNWCASSTWSTATFQLPPACNNNPNVKIGFRWNNTNAVGSSTTISVAIDSISLSGTSVTSLAQLKSIKNLNFNLYPNPTQDKLHLNLDIAKNCSYKIIITNILGQIVQEFSSMNSFEEIDISLLKNGIYYLQVQNPGGQKIQKFVKE